MQLKIKKEMRKSIIYIDLETVNFCAEENKMLDQFGEPIIKLNKMYGKYPVAIERKIRSNFKVRVKFDGEDNVQDAVEQATKFIEDMESLVIETMNDFMFEKEDIAIQFAAGTYKSESTDHNGHGNHEPKDIYYPYYPRK